jgi:hypothetical protein
LAIGPSNSEVRGSYPHLVRCRMRGSRTVCTRASGSAGRAGRSGWAPRCSGESNAGSATRTRSRAVRGECRLRRGRPRSRSPAARRPRARGPRGGGRRAGTGT